MEAPVGNHTNTLDRQRSLLREGLLYGNEVRKAKSKYLS